MNHIVLRYICGRPRTRPERQPTTNGCSQFRTGIRQFLSWSEAAGAAVGVTPAHHQLLLAIRGHDGGDDPTIGDIADALVLRHNSAVGLVDRAVDAGLVVRHTDPHDARVVRLRLPRSASRRIRQLSRAAPRGAAPARAAHVVAVGRSSSRDPGLSRVSRAGMRRSGPNTSPGGRRRRCRTTFSSFVNA